MTSKAKRGKTPQTGLNYALLYNINGKKVVCSPSDIKVRDRDSFSMVLPPQFTQPLGCINVPKQENKNKIKRDKKRKEGM